MQKQPLRSVLDRFAILLELVLGCFFVVMVVGNRGYMLPGTAPEDVVWLVCLVLVTAALFTALVAALLQQCRVVGGAQALAALSLLVLSGVIVSDLVRDAKNFEPSPFAGASMALALAGFAGLFGWFAWRALKSL